MRPAWLLVALWSGLGCGARSVAGEELEPTSGVACGEDVCAEGEGCAVCPEGPRCGARPDDAPDFWTLAMVCAAVDPGVAVPTLLCDDADDCDEGLRCEWHGAEAFCDLEPPVDECTLDQPRTPACRTDDDCPACSVGCQEVDPLLTVGRCEY